MVVDQINVERITFLKAKDHAPVAGNADAPNPFQVAFHGMQTPAGKQSHVLRTLGLIDGQENVGYFLRERRRNFLFLPGFVEPL